MSKKPTTSKIIQTMLAKLVADYAPERIVLFGSHVIGNNDKDSAIDLLIIKETTERFLDRWVQVQGILTRTHPSTPVETLILTPGKIEQRLANSDQLVAEIINTGQLLYAN